MIQNYFSILICALSLLTALIILGSILSKKYDFNYGYISLFSMMIYLSVGYFGASLIDPIAGVTLGGIIGLYEATAGFKIMIKLGANIEDLTDDMDDIIDENFNPHPGMVVMSMFIFMVIGWVGTLFA